MLETIILFVVILWLVGFYGKGHAGVPQLGNSLHVLLIIVVVLLIVRFII